MTDLDEDARRILDLSRAARTPSATDKARVDRRLGALLGTSAATAAGIAAAKATAAAQAGSGGLAGKSSLSAAAALKWFLGGGVLVGAAMGGYVAVSSGPAEEPAAQPPAAKLEPADAARAGAPEAPPMPGPQEPPQQRLQEQPGQQVAPDSLGAEVELLHRAQAAWRRRDAQQALSLLQVHRARYPHSKLALERDALRVLTLCALGRSDEAAPIAREFLAHSGRSPLRASVEQSCALR